MLNRSVRKYKRRNDGELIPPTATKNQGSEKSFREALINPNLVPPIYIGQDEDESMDTNQLGEDFLMNVAFQPENGTKTMPNKEVFPRRL